MSKALAVQCQSAELSIEAAAELATCVRNIPWTDPLHLTAVMTALANAGDGDAAASASGRRKMQDFRMFPLYLTTGLWLALKEGSSSCGALLQYLVSVLGLRCPTEKTVQTVAAYLYWLLGEKGVLHEEAFAQVQFIKKKIKDLAMKIGRGNVYLESLPRMPSTLFEEHPQFFKSVFGDELPQKLSPDQLAAIDDIARYIPMRSTKRNAGSSSSSSSIQGQLIPFQPTANVQQGGNMNQMMMMMMQCCQQMMHGQRSPEKAEPSLNIFRGNLKNAVGNADDILQPPMLKDELLPDSPPKVAVKKEDQPDVAVKKEAQPDVAVKKEAQSAAADPSPMAVEAAPKEVEEAEANLTKPGGSVHDTAMKLLDQIKKKKRRLSSEGQEEKKRRRRQEKGGGEKRWRQG